MDLPAANLVTGVDFITVPTRDVGRAEEFYGTVLGLPCLKRWGSMPAAEFETGTLTIAVMQSDAFGQEFIEALSVLWSKEDVLPGVAPQDDVVEPAGNVQSGFAGHWARLDNGRALCN